MINTVQESYYPLTFREKISQKLGKLLKNRQTVIMIGMRRVGISNFLRFFLSHDEVLKKYVTDEKNHIFIHIDLNDLVEMEIFPFWMLTLKRITDNCERSDLDPKTKKYIANLFLDSIQSKDLFLLVDCVRLCLIKLIQSGFIPTLFFIHFDRIKDAVTPSFLANLESLRDVTNQKLSYVLTSYRSFNKLIPKASNFASPSLIMHQIFVGPADPKDLETIFEANNKKFHLNLPTKLKPELFRICGGYIQYLQLALITLSEKNDLQKDFPLLPLLIADERITLQSEELWDSLTLEEQTTLLKVLAGEKISDPEIHTSKYLWDTGLIKKQVFSPIFANFLKSRQVSRQITENTPTELSKKEYLLFTFLQKNLDKICERESIIEAVWPEEEELGVSDWAIDRLVARVRSKLNQQKSQFVVVTVKTRGYKLTKNT